MEGNEGLQEKILTDIQSEIRRILGDEVGVYNGEGTFNQYLHRLNGSAAEATRNVVAKIGMQTMDADMVTEQQRTKIETAVNAYCQRANYRVTYARVEDYESRPELLIIIKTK